jgi:hypothetical protein
MTFCKAAIPMFTAMRTSDLVVGPLLAARDAHDSVSKGGLTFFLSACHWAVPCLKGLVAGLLPRCPGSDPSSSRVGFVVDKVVL